MATKPDKFPEWANDNPVDPTSGQSARVAPPQSKKDSGWSREEVPPRQWFNWLSWKTNQWILWLEESVDDLLSRMTTAESNISEVKDRTETLVVDATGDGDIDLTGTKAALIILEGVRTGDGTVTFADDARSYFVIEDTSGDFTLSAKTDTGSDTIPIVRDEMIRVWSDGSEINTSIRRERLELTSGFDAGQFVTIEREGNTVRLFTEGPLSHPSDESPRTPEGFLPDWATPTDVGGLQSLVYYNDSRPDGVLLFQAQVTSTGRLEFIYRNTFSGGGEQRTSNARAIYFVYRIQSTS